MLSLLTADQKKRYNEFNEFIKANVAPNASKWDKNEEMPDDFIRLLGDSGYLGANIPTEFGGKGWDFVTFGLLNEAVGRGISSLTDLLTIQAMVSMTLLRWGSKYQKDKWLNPLAKGEVIGAFALTEQNAGSAIQNLESNFKKQGNKYILNGRKRWTSYGEKADLFLIFGKDEDNSIAALITKDTP